MELEYTDSEKEILIEWNNLRISEIKEILENPCSNCKKIRDRISNIERNNRALFIQYAIEKNIKELWSIGREEILEAKNKKI